MTLYKSNLMYNISTILHYLYYEKIKSNRGALTPGTDFETVDEIAEINFQHLASEITDNNLFFGKSRRIYVEKPGKVKLRPITIPNIRDRIVQEGIRVILNAIYEPTFRKQKTNYGFRPATSCNDAIDNVKNEARQMDFAIEGDIEGAYDNVNQNKMISILSFRIKDKKFLKLIKQLHGSGIVEKNTSKDTTLGIPQGGTASPILFNIYMHELDKYIAQKYTLIIDQINSERKLNPRDPTSRRYNQLDRKSRYTYLRIDTIFRRTGSSSISELKNTFPKDFELYKQAKKTIEKSKSMKFKYPSQASHLKTARFYFIRYADDWIFLSNLSFEQNIEIKKDIATFLKDELGLSLSDEKTKVTNLHKEPAKFLGFIIRNWQHKAPTTSFTANRRVRLTQEIKPVRVRIRKVFKAFIGIDHDRVKWRMRLKGFLNKQNRPCCYILLLQLKDHEIVWKFSRTLEGLFNYYIGNLTFNDCFCCKNIQS